MYLEVTCHQRFAFGCTLAVTQSLELCEIKSEKKIIKQNRIQLSAPEKNLHLSIRLRGHRGVDCIDSD